MSKMLSTNRILINFISGKKSVGQFLGCISSTVWLINWRKQTLAQLYGTGECTDWNRTVNSSSAIEYVPAAIQVLSTHSVFGTGWGISSFFPRPYNIHRHKSKYRIGIDELDEKAEDKCGERCAKKQNNSVNDKIDSLLLDLTWTTCNKQSNGLMPNVQQSWLATEGANMYVDFWTYRLLQLIHHFFPQYLTDWMVTG